VNDGNNIHYAQIPQNGKITILSTINLANYTTKKCRTIPEIITGKTIEN